MTTDGVKTKLGYRICDWIGNTILEPLPHLHQSTWTINGMQSGASGSVAVGNFTIPLYPPRSDTYKLYKGQYDLVKAGMRVEAYIANDDGDYMNGTQPVFSGIIHKINFTLDKYELTGFDSLWLAQQQGYYPGMSIVSSGGGSLIAGFNDVDNLLLADDFNGNKFPSNITWNTILGSGFTFTTDDGLPGYSHSIAGDNLLAATIGANPVADMHPAITDNLLIIEGWFHLSNLATGASAHGQAEIIYLSDSAGSNLFLAMAVITAGTGATYNVQAQLWHKSSGTYTQDVVTTVFTGLTDADRRIQLIVIVNLTITNAWNVRLLVNGKDSNCTVSYVPSSPFNLPNRYYGFKSTNGGSPPVTSFMTRFYMKTRLQLLYTDTGLTQVPVQPFTEGAGPIGFSEINLTALNGLTEIDLWSLGATLEGYIWRKDPIRLVPRGLGGAAINDTGDFITWGVQGVDPGAGFDLSKTISLDEEINIVSGGQLANAESLGSEVRFGFDPSPDSDGSIIWPDINGMLSIGQGSRGAAPLILADPVSATGLHDMLIARRMAETSGARKALTSSGSKQFTILRDAKIASPHSYTYNNATSPVISATSLNAFKELDFINLNCPTLGIFNQRVSVQSYTFRENDATMDVTLDQFSFRDKLLNDRRKSNNLDVTLLTFTPRA